jgi:rSAM/selenodomain-associated transferase 2
MAWGFEKSFREGSKATVIIGADCPELTSDLLSEAFARLGRDPVVLGPAKDGGYYLIGLRGLIPELFRGLRWGTDTVLSDSLRILEAVGLKATLLKPLYDIDRPEDLTIWRRITQAEEADLHNVSVIIPTLNEAQHIGATVASAAQGNPEEILVVDGGSCDETTQKARAAGASVVVSRRGRARQMNAGATRAVGNVLLFLHADTQLPPGYATLIVSPLRNPKVAAGAFRFAIAEVFPGSRLVEFMTNLRSRWLRMPYGDQGLFMCRSLFEELGGFADLPVLEDYEMVCRLRRRGRVLTITHAAMTSARRWQRLGFLRTTLVNQWVILGYRLGWPIEKLARIYRMGGRQSFQPSTHSSVQVLPGVQARQGKPQEMAGGEHEGPGGS